MVEITRGDAAGHPVVIVHGDVDMANVDELVAALASSEGDLLIDLDGVEYIDSFGVRALVRAVATRRSVGSRCAVICRQGSAADLTLRVAGVDDDLLAESSEQAVARFRASP